ncbi:MAG: aspartate/glutamate racemase family protein [Lentisphaeria bacterium]|nr:aspartate/glutamate racemase family protein [Lentisphaeria bacterium]
MKIAVCDSGLGGLDIAAKLYAKGGCGELLYFNVWPEVDRGFGKMPPDERVQVWERAFDGIMKYLPDLLVIGCNTLSVVHRRSSRYGSSAAPVLDIVDAAVNVCGDYLRANPEKKLLILGTAETVNSGCYRDMLIGSGISAERINGLPMPGLATLIEESPFAPAVSQRIREGYSEAVELCGGVGEHALGLCCTHFGYVPEIWDQYFAPAALLNPNEKILDGVSFPAGQGGITVRFISKIPMSESKITAMLPLFASTPAVADALKYYEYTPGLYQVR